MNLTEIKSQITALSELSEDYNGYGALKISTDSISYALECLGFLNNLNFNQATIVHFGSDGKESIEIQWQHGGRRDFY